MKMETMIPKEKAKEYIQDAIDRTREESQHDTEKLRLIIKRHVEIQDELKEEVEAQKQANTLAMQTIEQQRKAITELESRIRGWEVTDRDRKAREDALMRVVEAQATALAKG